MKFGEMLKVHRKRNGWTLAHVGEKVNIDTTTLWRIERGKYKPPEIVPFVYRLGCLLGLHDWEKRVFLLLAVRGRFGEER